ncbi:MAG: diaminopimelate decarboxylase [Muribaculaceae bacterium]
MKNSLALKFNTPCFVLDKNVLRRNIAAAREAFAGWRLGYSVKTNWLPAILKEVRLAGMLAEVVSPDEFRLALLCGFQTKDIIYNGPCKDFETFRQAIEAGTIVNIDSWREVDWLAETAPSCPSAVRVGVRLNIVIEADRDVENSRFGFSEETGETGRIFERLAAIPNVRIAGLHLHRSSSNRRVDNYRLAIRQAAETIARHGISNTLEYIDVGGNFSAPLPGHPSLDNYARAIVTEAGKCGLTGISFIAEPGNALVATAFDYVVEVTDVREPRPGEFFVATDGRRNDVDPLFRANQWKRKVVCGPSNPPLAERRVVGRQILCGCTCMEHDRILEFENHPSLLPGDRVVIHHAGAYTLALAPMFISQLPAVYCLDGNAIGLCREPWKPEAWLR